MTEHSQRRSSSPPPPPLPTRDYRERAKQGRRSGNNPSTISADASTSGRELRAIYKHSVSVEDAHDSSEVNFNREERGSERRAGTRIDQLNLAPNVLSSASVDLETQSVSTTLSNTLKAEDPIGKSVTSSTSCTSLTVARSSSSSKSNLSLTTYENQSNGIGHCETDSGKDARSGSNASILSGSDDWYLVPNNKDNYELSPPAAGNSSGGDARKRSPNDNRKGGVLKLFRRKEKTSNSGAEEHRLLNNETHAGTNSNSKMSADDPMTASSAQTPRRPHVAPLHLNSNDAKQGQGVGVSPSSGTPARTPPQPPSRPPPPQPGAPPGRLSNSASPSGPSTINQQPMSFSPLSVDTGAHIVSEAQMQQYLYNESPASEAEFSQYVAARFRPMAGSHSAGNPANPHPTLVHANTLPVSAGSGGMGNLHVPGHQTMLPGGQQQVRNTVPQLHSMLSAPSGQPMNATAYFFNMQPGPATAPVNNNNIRFPYPDLTGIDSQRHNYTSLLRVHEQNSKHLEELRREVNELEKLRHGCQITDRTSQMFCDLCGLRDENRRLAIDSQFLAYDLDMVLTASAQQMEDCLESATNEMNRLALSQSRWQSSPALTDWLAFQRQQQLQTEHGGAFGGGVQVASAASTPQSHYPTPNYLGQGQVPFVYPPTQAGYHLANAGSYPTVVYPATPSQMLQTAGNAAGVNLYVSPPGAQTPLPMQQRPTLGRPHAASQPIIDINDDEMHKWPCLRCTFINHPALSVCEICCAERGRAADAAPLAR